MPKVEIHSLSETKREMAKIKKAAQEAIEALRRILSAENDPIQILKQMKFEKIGRSPFKPDDSLNIIEQVNETFTALTTFMAVEKLYELHPDRLLFRLW